MKRFLILALTAFIGFGILSETAEAQKKKKKKSKGNKKEAASSKKSDKKSEKEWKKRLKKLTAGQYQSIMEEYYDLKNQVVSFDDEIAACQASIAEKDQVLKKYQVELSKLRKALAAAKKAGARPAAGTAQNPNAQYLKGVVFKVQIGAYEHLDLRQFDGQENFGVEQQGGMTKYTIGNFREYRSANVLKTYIQKMGLKDAFVVAYRDGTRVELSSVIGGLGQG